MRHTMRVSVVCLHISLLFAVSAFGQFTLQIPSLTSVSTADFAVVVSAGMG